jgi:hypothetical protein
VAARIRYGGNMIEPPSWIKVLASCVFAITMGIIGNVLTAPAEQAAAFLWKSSTLAIQRGASPGLDFGRVEVKG